MSKKSKKKFNKVEVQWKDDDLNLPTVASAIPQRHNRGGYGQSSYRSNSMNNYGDKPMESESDRGPWRRGPGPSTSSSSSSFNNNSFNSSRNNNNNNNSFNSSRNSFRSSRNNDNQFNNNNSRDDNNNNASDSVHNWRDIKKKEQPKYTLNSKSSSNNSNPWRKDNNNINNINNTEMQGRGAFGSKTVSETPNINNSNSNSFSRNSFGSRNNDNNNNRYNPSKFANNSPSKFGSSSSSQSKFGASQSKFASGGGFAASAMKNIDNGKTRLSYSKNSRFASILDDGKDNNNENNNNNNNKPVLQAPSKNVNNRFKLPSTSSSEQQAFPGLSKANGQVRRHEPTVKELEKELKKMNKDNNERNNAKNKLLNKKKDNKNNNNINSKQKRENKNNNNNNNNNNKKVFENVDKSVGKNKQKGNIKKEEKKQNEKKKILIDKKLVKKFNKECLGQNKSIEINKDTERLILFGLNQKENILKRKEDNYEKIAQLLSGVIFNEKNINRKKSIDLNVIYDIIYNKTQLCNEKELFLALVLELLSLIEIKKSCLGVVSIIQKGNMFDKYLKRIQDIQTENVMKEFEEYGLQYVYPLNGDVVKGVNDVIGNQSDMNGLIGYLKGVREKQMIYTNYEVLKMILIYILNKYYFSQISEDEEKNEEIAKILCMSDDKNTKTEFRELIELLHCKTDEKDDNDSEDEDEEEEDDEEEDDDDDDIDSHSLLIVSNIISISSMLKNNNNGLVSILKIMELNGLISYKIIRKFVQCDDDKYTFMRLDGLSKLTDWIAELDARQARIEMENDNEDDFDDDDNVDNEYAGNLLKQRKHKTASDYETISFVE